MATRETSYLYFDKEHGRSLEQFVHSSEGKYVREHTVDCNSRDYYTVQGFLGNSCIGHLTYFSI